MNRAIQQRGSARWPLIVAGAVVIGCILVQAVWLHWFSPWNGASGDHAAAGGENSLDEKWQFKAGPVAAALALADDGTVYAASEDGYLYALNASGGLEWKFNAGPMLAAPTVGDDGTVYVTNEEQRIFAVNREGAQRWAAGGGPFADKQMGSVAAAIDRNHLYTPWRGLLRAVRLADGGFDWPAGLGFQRGGSISLLPNGLLVYSGVGRMDAVDWTGRTQWQYPVMNPPLSVDMLTRTGGRIPAGNFWLDSPIAVGYDGTIYVCAADSRLVALSPEGSFKWEFKTDTHIANHASPVIAVDGTIYFASADGHLYAFTPEGERRWVLDTGGPISATPVLAQDETIYVVNATAPVAVSSEGKLLGKGRESGLVDSSPTLAPDGTVYVAWRDGRIAAFAGKHGGLMNSAWPKFQATLANSGIGHSF